MKKKIFLFFTVLLFFTPFATFSQETHDSIKLTERNDAFLNYDNYRSSITDTTIDVLKKLVELQTDLIITDNYIIHNYISINTKKTDDLQKIGPSITQLNHTLTRFNKISTRIEDGPGTLHDLIYDQAISDDIKSLTGGANRSKVLKYFIRESIKNNNK